MQEQLPRKSSPSVQGCIHSVSQEEYLPLGESTKDSISSVLTERRDTGPLPLRHAVNPSMGARSQHPCWLRSQGKGAYIPA